MAETTPATDALPSRLRRWFSHFLVFAEALDTSPLEDFDRRLALIEADVAKLKEDLQGPKEAAGLSPGA